MNVQLRKLRGVISLSLIWGIMWVMVFAALLLVLWFIDPGDIDEGEGWMIAIIGCQIGLVSGVVFSILLSFAESGRAAQDISLLRAMLWGILASAVFPLLAGRYNQVFVMCPIGAIVALVYVAISRKAGRGDSGQLNRLCDAFFLTPVRDTINPQEEPST